jgi:ribosome maturation factor RimP
LTSPGKRNAPAPVKAGTAKAAPAIAAEHAALEQRLHALCETVAAALGLEVVAVHLAGGMAGGHLQVLIDRTIGRGSVRLDDCVAVSRRLSELLDTEDPIEAAYDLEVSSPGMTRVLRHQADFERFAGMTAKVTIGTPDGGKESVTGVIGSVADGVVTLTIGTTGKTKAARAEAKAHGRAGTTPTRTLALADVQKARLDPTLAEWAALGRKLAEESAALGELPSDMIEGDVGDEDTDDEATSADE